ncbi:DUF5133 domain-containing protein [Streptomyces sp. NPDC048404]|uniref:DUF5133 domain-containing protein n=1 Tax=unclassified Streptomyces TaxID=2593676 RepID=UPI00343C3313
MLMPLPATLRRLVAEYTALLAEEAPDGTHAATSPDLAYTLCVSTGTSEITDALDTARAYLARSAVAPVAPVAPVARVAGSAGREVPSSAGAEFEPESDGYPSADHIVSAPR